VIRKLAAFLVLLVAGFVILHFAIGGESFGGIGQLTRTQPPRRPDELRDGVVVPAGGDGKSAIGELVVEFRGELDLPNRRPVALPGGGSVELLSHHLKARDSRPLGNGMQRLDDVTVEFYETGGTRAAPAAVHAGTLRAGTAFVTVARDAKGRPSVQQDRDMDLRDVVLTTPAGARVAGARLTVARALARSTEDGLAVRTDDPGEPFQLDVAGADPLHLTGRGLEATFPQARGGERAATGTARVAVASDPELRQTRGGRTTTLRARGPLVYREDLGSGVAFVTARDDVAIDGLAAGGAPATARGDRVAATLVRARREAGASQAAAPPAASWRAIHLRGAPARLVGEREELTCAELDVAPNVRGQPWLFTASGAPRLESRAADGTPTTFTAERCIRLVRLRPLLEPGAALGGFGAAGFAGQDQLVLFEGASQVRSGELEASASDGLRILRGEQADAGATIRGQGSITIRGEDGLAVTGTDGFLLHRAAGAETMRIGPRTATTAHRFTVRQQDLDVHGGGLVRLERTAGGAGRARIVIDSPAGDAVLARERGTLRSVRRLDAEVAGRQLVRFDATGAPCGIELPASDGVVSGQAHRVESSAPRHVTLHGGGPGAAASLAGARGEQVRGDRIDVHQRGATALVVARGDSRITVRQPVAGGVREVELRADDCRLLPDLLEPWARQWWLAAYPPELRAVLAAPLAGNHLLARGHVHVVHRDPAGPQLQARGDWLFSRLEPAAGVVRGAPAQVERTGPGRESLTAIAARLRFHTGHDGEHLTLVREPGRDPELRLSGVRQLPGSDPDDRFHVLCQGDVEVLPDKVIGKGPVTGRTHGPDGVLDPGGMALDAGGLWLVREPSTGDVREIMAGLGADLRLRQVRARGEQLTLDLAHSVVMIDDRSGNGRIDGPLGAWRGVRVQYNFVTMEVSAWASGLSFARN
jgi:hypothetical protein